MADPVSRLASPGGDVASPPEQCQRPADWMVYHLQLKVPDAYAIESLK
jgi:hypothetical protein